MVIMLDRERHKAAVEESALPARGSDSSPTVTFRPR